MALNDILAAMEREAERDINAITAEAEATIAGIKAKAERDAKEIQTRLHNEQHAPVERERARRLNRARRDARNAIAHARETLLAEAMGGAQHELSGLRHTPQYPAVLQALVREATGAIGGPYVLRADPRDADLLRTIVPNAEIVFDLETWGGVEARSPDGRVTVTNTLEARMYGARAAMRQAVMPLFGGG